MSIQERSISAVPASLWVFAGLPVLRFSYFKSFLLFLPFFFSRLCHHPLPTVLGTPLHFHPSYTCLLLSLLFLAEWYIMVTLSLFFGATNNMGFRKQGYSDGRGEIKRWLSSATVKSIITATGTVINTGKCTNLSTLLVL